MHFILTLDVTTMIFVNMALYGICFLAQLMVLKWDPDIPGTKLMAWGNILGFAGYFSLLMQIFEWYIPSILTGNVCIACSYYFYFCGLGMNAERPVRRHGFFLAVLGLYLTLLFHFSTARMSLPIRVAIIMLFLGSLSLATAVQLWPKLRVRSHVHCLMSLIFSVHSVFSLNWAVRSLLETSDTRTMLEGGSFMTPIYLQSILFLYAFNMAYMVMISMGLQERLRKQARVDYLTGLYNRMAFSDLSGRIFRRAEIDGSSVALLMLDLDHFKAVNDTYGHAVGDEVLSHFARATSETLRPSDLMSRFGGEEFVVLLPRADAETALGVAERLRNITEGLSFSGSGKDLKITVSIGVVVGNPAEGYDFKKLFRLADEALYRAKNLGRNRAELAEPAIPATVSP